MDMEVELFDELVQSHTYKSVHCFLDRLDFLITNEIGVQQTDQEFYDLLDDDFLREVKNFSHAEAYLHFGSTLKDLKCVISDEDFREHVAWIEYIGPKSLRLKDMGLPRSHIQDQVYSSINEVVNVFKKHVGELSNYFRELSDIDLRCIVMEPHRPTFKEDYRKILLVDRTWLHVEVSPNGSAKNLTVLGQCDYQRELQKLLQAWDHNRQIAQNVLNLISCLRSHMDSRSITNSTIDQPVEAPECRICFCVVLPGDTKVPQPLCHNSKCGAYFHRSCLYEWLVSCARGRSLQFVVGKCPCCSEYIQCSDRDIR